MSLTTAPLRIASSTRPTSIRASGASLHEVAKPFTN